VRIATYPTARNLVVGPPAVALPCEGWKAIENGWQYRDDAGSAGGIRLVRYTTRGLTIVAGAPASCSSRAPSAFCRWG
jgi:hypothetical protein